MIDEFDGSALDAAWTFVDPVGDCSVTVQNSCAELALPAASSHDSITGATTDPRLLRAVPAGTSWQVVASFRSQVRKVATQGHGIVVCDAANAVLIRADVYGSSSNNTKAFCRDATAIRVNADVWANAFSGCPAHLRLKRTNDDWEFATSYNGIDWRVHATFTNASVASNGT